MSNLKFKRKISSKTLWSFLQMPLLISGIIVGVILVLQPQLLGSDAFVVGYIPPNLKTCDFGPPCQVDPARGASQCLAKSGSSVLYCCSSGQSLVNNVCTGYKDCGKGLYCEWDTELKGSSICINEGRFDHCCPEGQIIKNHKCVTPFLTPATPIPGSTLKPFACDKASWIDGKCGEGGCYGFQRYQFRIIPSTCGMAPSRCTIDFKCIK